MATVRRTSRYVRVANPPRCRVVTGATAAARTATRGPLQPATFGERQSQLRLHLAVSHPIQLSGGDPPTGGQPAARARRPARAVRAPPTIILTGGVARAGARGAACIDTYRYTDRAVYIIVQSTVHTIKYYE